jgi:hypothetical protein
VGYLWQALAALVNPPAMVVLAFGPQHAHRVGGELLVALRPAEVQGQAFVLRIASCAGRDDVRMADGVVHGLAGRLLRRIVFDLLVSERFIAHGSLLLGQA